MLYVFNINCTQLKWTSAIYNITNNNHTFYNIVYGYYAIDNYPNSYWNKSQKK